MLSIVLGELDIINEIALTSDKFSPSDWQKMQSEFQRDLENNKYPSRHQIQRYIKDEKVGKGKDKKAASDKEGAPPVEEDQTEDQQESFETIFSRNPKLNVTIANGLAGQIERN